MNLVFLGPPGVGKGTQAAKVAAALNLTHVATGDILRAALRAGTRTGLEAKTFMDAGRLVPDDVVNRLVREKLQSEPDGRGVLFDGYPRTLAQAGTLEVTLRELGRTLDRVLDFRAPDAALVERISGRRTCGKCHAAYHVKFAPSTKGERCERCGEALVQRTDDLPETVNKRLEVYRKDTAGVSDRFRKSGIYEEIDADRPIDAVTKDVMERVGKAK